DQLMERGEGIYKNSCMACHGVAGEGGLGKPIAGSAIAMGDIQRHLDVIVNGIASTSMPALGKQLNDVDLAAVTTYQRNAFGNNMGDLVQPIDVYNYKNGQ
ncbi:MAG: cytochrome c oxidase subunit 2, partial [Halieaceae bacterium]